MARSALAIVLGIGVWLTIFHFAPRLGLYLGWLPCLQVGFLSYFYPAETIELVGNILGNLFI